MTLQLKAIHLVLTITLKRQKTKKNRFFQGGFLEILNNLAVDLFKIISILYHGAHNVKNFSVRVFHPLWKRHE